MFNFWNDLLVYVGSFTGEQWLWMGLAGLIVLYIMYNRKQYVNLFDNAVIMAETSFLHGANKEKLDAAVKYIQRRTATLPFFARLIIQTFLSRKRIEYIIEKTLQKFSDIFGSGHKVNIQSGK